MSYTKKTLASGLRVIIVPMPGSLTTTVRVLTQTGSKYESKQQNGVAHFLEHLCFKGTKKRPNAQAITEELDMIGASSNAFTAHEYTGYYAKAEPHHFEKILDIVADIFINSTFPKAEIEKERGVIVGEIEMYEDQPQDEVADLFTDLLYGDQPAGRKILGTRETIRTLSRTQIAAYHAKHYVASRTIVIVAGKVDEKAALKAVERAFAGIPRGAGGAKKKVIERQHMPAIAVRHKKTSQTHLILGFRSIPITDTRTHALAILRGVLGGGMSSRLYRRIREEMGAGYYVGASNEFFTDHGFFAIHAGVDSVRVEEVIRAIMEEVRRLCDEPIGEAELTKAKNMYASGLVAGLETSGAQASYYGFDEVHNLPIIPPHDEARLLHAVTAQEVQDIARAIFTDDRLNLALVGPHKNAKPFEKLLTVHPAKQ